MCRCKLAKDDVFNFYYSARFCEYEIDEFGF